MLWFLNLVAFIINAVVVGSSTFGALGETNEVVSDDNPTFITPADWAFVIWALIFLTEIILVIWMVFNRDEPIIAEGLGIWFALACIIQAVWSVTFAQEQLELSAILLVAIAVSLGIVVIRLTEFKKKEPSLCPGFSYWVVHFPIGLHGGWVLAASLVNINVALNDPSVSQEVTACILSLVAAAIGAGIAALFLMDRIYPLSVVWALAAVSDNDDYRKQRLGSSVADGVTNAITGLYVVLLLFVVLTLVYSLFFATPPEKEHHTAPRENRGGYSRRNDRRDGRRDGRHVQRDLTPAMVGP